MAEILNCTTLVKGMGEGPVLSTGQTISFWGGVNSENGKIIDPRHELFGRTISGKILTFPYGKGSAAAPMVLLELVKQGTMPAAIVNIEADPLMVAGPIIGKYFYSKNIPVVLLPQGLFSRLKTGQKAEVDGWKDKIIIKNDPGNEK